MKKTSLLCVLLFLAASSMPSMANFSSHGWCQPPSCPCEEGAIYTSRTSPNALDVLAHENFYIWKMTGLSIPDGQHITQAGLTFYSINNWQEPDDDMLYIRLMNSSEIIDAKNDLGMWTSVVASNGRVYAGRDQLYGADDLTGYGESLGEYYDDNAYWNGWRWVNPAENYDIAITGDALTDLDSYIRNNGIIGIGLDSDCRYNFTSDCKIKFWYCTTPTIPVPGAILLGGIGVALVGWLRRRRTL